MVKVSVLSKEELLEGLSQSPPLVEGLLNPDEQLQPNGIDLTLREVALLSSPGRLGSQGERRRLAATSPLIFDSSGFMSLTPGPYLITFNEVLHLPRDTMALGLPRSSLLRSGVSIHTAVWDAGYSGRSQALMVVYNPQGFSIQKNARVLQLVFIRLGRVTSRGYEGMFQGEGL